ncbi:TRAP transporter large permease [Xanthobacteraceae bacterium Astr-EGSB]|uniref:TRAP transporter large permease n=1 Tax=Astrobacterium formosum TaxID=3069710 RepID=UPI0027B56D55|nr:TRAP transporter large permease [Xanthobacteraceae bacterium Astr-EGSB]
MELGIFFAVFVVLFLLGLPIAFAMITSTLAYALMADIDLGFLSTQMFAGLDSFVLLAIPLFILASEVMNTSSVAKRIFDFCDAMVGHVPGGLGHVNVAANIIFSGMSGSAVADVGGIGRICYNAMVKAGYPSPFSAAVTAAAAVIGPIIPPSIPMVVFAMVSGVSVARLFFAGAVPGLIIGLFMMVYIYVAARRCGYPMAARQGFARMITSFMHGFLPLMTPAILLGGIWLGFVTITEAAALAVFYAAALGGLAYRLLGPKEFYDCLKNVFVFSGPILILLPAAKVFGFVLTSENIPTLFADYVLAISSNKLFVLLAINVLFLFLGCISDPTVNIMLFVPIVMPLAKTIGMDPVHFGVMVVFNCMIGLITPPVGTLLFCLCGFEKMPLEVLVRAIWPFVIILLAILVLIALFPAIVLTLPNYLF